MNTKSLNEQLNNYVYSMFSDYYSGLQMTKIKDAGSFSVYYANIHTMIMSSRRYIMVTVPQDINIPGTKIPLSQLKWVSLQSRETDDEYKLKPQTYKPSPQSLNNLKNIYLVQKKSEDDHVSFNIENDQIPVTVTMLRSSSSVNFPKRFPLEWALKEFKTIVMISNF
jgi:hypothetical protein